MSLGFNLPPGTVIAGDFRIERPLDSGGMGTVYLVRQLSTHRLRALKLMHPQIAADGKAAERFQREAMVGGLIGSEHVVEVLGAGIDPQAGLPWLCMELLEGQDLEQYLGAASQSLLARPLAAQLLRQLFRAIAAAHAAGVVHRDLKPKNIFLHKSGLDGLPFVVKVLDFGISKILSETKLPSETGRLGTVGWMAPEQMRAGPCGASADVWALGLLTFFVLTGRRFWLQEHNEHGNIQSLLLEMVVDPIGKASERAEQLGCPSRLTPGFDEWFSHCVERDPLRRFSDAQVAWFGLEPLLAAMLQPVPSASLSPSPEPTGEQACWATPPTGPSLSLSLSAGGKDIAPPAEPQAPSQKSQLPKAIAIALAGLLIGLGLIGAAAVAWGHRQKSPAPSAPDLSVSNSIANPAASETAQPEPGDPPAQILIPAGSWEKPGGRIQMQAFWMDRTEVTVENWSACAQKGKCDEALTAVNVAGQERWSLFCNYGRKQERAKHPINCVSYAQAKAYCEAQGERLPTEDEWYYAAYVAGQEPNRLYPWGREKPVSGQLNVCGVECAQVLRQAGLSKKQPFEESFRDDYPDTAPAGSFSKDSSPLGVLDLGGNVLEWTSTSVDSGKSYRCRGGAWNAPELSYIDSQAIYQVGATERRANLGFRCVSDAKEP